jgi:hypothetical protein
LGRFDIQLLTSLVPDHSGFFTAVAAHTLLRGTADDFLESAASRLATPDAPDASCAV